MGVFFFTKTKWRKYEEKQAKLLIFTLQILSYNSENENLGCRFHWTFICVCLGSSFLYVKRIESDFLAKDKMILSGQKDEA